MNEDEIENAIAIIGMSGRFPGAKDVHEFWNNLCLGTESISTFSIDALKNSGVSEKLLHKPNYVKSRGILEGVEFFDADFFGFNDKEAQLTDPQHRLFLECAWEALENAGYCPDNYSGAIGVYGGMGMSSYYLNNIYPNRELRESLGDFFLHINNEKDFLTTKTSYKLNLRGPSIAVQTACSTSLVAVCMACNHLLTYQCDMALAGAAAILVPQSTGYLYQEGMILSADGRCRPFDAEAQGTVMANGVGIVVLKRLRDAIQDRDHIFAVIRGYGINNDGSGKIGYSAPSVEGQEEVIASAISMAGIDPETITYAEAHGTGTILGDPIEIKGLTQAFHRHSDKKGYCAIGSVKSNIGHTVEAAGVIGLMKAALALYHHKIPPTLHFNKPNPHIDFEETPFYVNTVLKEWEANADPRRACVSSFGIGGTNSHAILEEWPQAVSPELSEPFYPLFLSAKTLTALKTMANNLGQYLQKYPNFSLADVAYTLQVGRKLFGHKRILICSNREEAIRLLLNFDPANYLSSPDCLKEDFCKGKQLYRIPLPTYPFEKKRYWIDPIKAAEENPTLSDRQYHSIEAQLIAIWEEFLGVESVGIQDDFFQLGGDSLLAIQVIARLREKFNLNIGMQILSEYPTVAKLAKFISERNLTSSPLIKLKAGSVGNPLFFIHPIEGNLFCYRDLINTLKCQNPLYGIQADDTETRSIAKIASRYIEEIRKVQPHGPYYLIGMSFGGIIAYEMARQLKIKGDSIALLCMVDTIKPDSSLLPLSDDKAMLACLIELLDKKPVLQGDLTSDKVIESLRLKMLSPEDQKIIFNRVNANLRALADYKLNPYEGKILFFQASERFFRLKDVCLGSCWKELVSEGIEIQEISGSHVNILMKPQVEMVAKFLDDYLQPEKV